MQPKMPTETMLQNYTKCSHTVISTQFKVVFLQQQPYMKRRLKGINREVYLDQLCQQKNGQDKHFFGQIYFWMSANWVNKINLAQFLAYQYHVILLSQ